MCVEYEDYGEKYRVIRVYCSRCKEQFDENNVKFLDIAEDFQGRDLLTFECPKCKTTQESLRVG